MSKPQQAGAPMDYDEEGRSLLAALNVPINTAAANGRRFYRDLDPIFRHPNGGCVYVGNLKAAKSKSILDEHKITCIVNCQGEESENYFESVPHMKYFRFVVAYWLSIPGIREDTGVRKFLKGVFHFIDSNIANGENVILFVAQPVIISSTSIFCLSDVVPFVLELLSNILLVVGCGIQEFES
eukprot:m.340259 g.340259  ORF g.340259 m.340259 type:complete len:183 (+) comp20591_c1_seq4:114-662(+)